MLKSKTSKATPKRQTNVTSTNIKNKKSRHLTTKVTPKYKSKSISTSFNSSLSTPSTSKVQSNLQSTSTSHFSTLSPKPISTSSPSTLFDDFNTFATVLINNPRQAAAMISHNHISPRHPLSHNAIRNTKALVAQQTILAASALGLVSSTDPTTTPTTQPPTSPTDLLNQPPTSISIPGSPIPQHLPPPTSLTVPTDLAPPMNPSATRNLDLSQAGITTTTTPIDGHLLEPVISNFAPPSPSRTIPIVHDGLEWDEPNFLFRPFVHVIDLLHDTTGLPWYATLISWAWILRTAISPLTYKQQASMVRFTLLQPEVLRINKELRAIDPKSNSFKQKQQELSDLYKKNGVGPFTSMFWSLASVPFYILSFMAIRNMANSPYFAGEFATGGFMPYMNLSASAGWELALVNAIVNLIVLHTSQPIPVHKMQKLQKIMFMASHVLIIGFIPLLSNINTASLMYFIANNSFSIFFQKLFYSDVFRKIAKLPTKDEVNAVRDIVTELQAQPASQSVDQLKKNAYVLDSNQKVKGGPSGTEDVLNKARQLVQKRQEDKKTFATGGAAAIEAQRLKDEQSKIAKEQEQVALSKRMEEVNRKNNIMKGTAIPGKDIVTGVNGGPRPEKAKVVQRKGGFKKH